MSGKGKSNAAIESARRGPRLHCLREIRVIYERRNEEILAKASDLSASGIFINTRQTFPVGAVLNLRFRLAVTNAVVRTRGEVRYCLRRVGVEFIWLAPEAPKDIKRELALNGEAADRARNLPCNRVPNAAHKSGLAHQPRFLRAPER